MGKISKPFALLLTLITAISSLTILTINPANAQNPSPTPYPIPSTPYFSITITNSSYFVPVTYSTDPSTGQKIANKSYYSGYVDALNVTIQIENQPLALSIKSNEYSGFKYFIELKPHNSANWTSLTGYLSGLGTYMSGLGFLPSNTSQTQLTFQFSNPYFPVNNQKEYPVNSSGLTYATNPFFTVTVAKNETLDFRVRAGIGNFQYISMGQLLYDGNFSDWNQFTITTPYQLLQPPTVASPKNYTVPPLSSLNLNVSLPSFGGMLKSGGLIYVKGGSGNDINLRVIDPQGKTVLDLGRISNEKEFYITPYQTGNYTIILDNEFSVFSSKEVKVFSYTYPENGFEFVGFSINVLAIILIIVSIVVICLIVGLLLYRRHQKTQV
ncbi:MAG: emp24/gp25L/p24 family protein [Candidatus Bathyarchaeota archaeon]|nr:emp24/gp25L/p24 family protein [Candidatus Bathyarchaeota archaeon]